MAENRRIQGHFNARSRNQLGNQRQRQRYFNHTTSQPHVDHTAPVYAYLQAPPPVLAIAPNPLVDARDQRTLMVARDPSALAQGYPMLYGAEVSPPTFPTMSNISPAPDVILPAVSNVPAPTHTLNMMFSNLSVSDQASSRPSVEPRLQSDSTSRVFCGPQLPPHMLFRMMFGPAVPPLSTMINHGFVPGLPTAQTQTETRDEDEWISPEYRYIPSTEEAAVSDRHNGPEDSDVMERDSRRYRTIMCPNNNNGECPNEDCQYMHGATCYVCRMPRLDLYRADRRERHLEECLVEMSTGKQCGICQANIPLSHTTKNFTILLNCPHSFCHRCLGRWLLQMDLHSNRFCPFCDTPSVILFKSNYWLNSEELKHEIYEYSESLLQMGNMDLLNCLVSRFIMKKIFGDFRI
nr:putative E3 ubiquitin-protein ligase makorin-1 [Biomphalaria glabrata]